MKRWHDLRVSASALVVSLGLGACSAEAPEPGRLALTRLDQSTIAGSLASGDSLISFESWSPDQRRVELHLDIDGAAMEFSYDRRGILTEDGGRTVLGTGELAALLDLRDAVGSELPGRVQSSLEGMFLARHADWLADAPAGYAVDTRLVDVQDRMVAKPVARAGDKSVENDDADTTCLRPGSTYTAWFDGADGTVWRWNRIANSGRCLGRCGVGCNLFDHDLMLDCFEHDSCSDRLSGGVGPTSANCGDEFGHAVAEYLVTYGSWCP